MLKTTDSELIDLALDYREAFITAFQACVKNREKARHLTVPDFKVQQEVAAELACAALIAHVAKYNAA